MTQPRRFSSARVIMAGSALAVLAACDQPLDFDLRGHFGNAFSTSEAARGVSAERPKPDDRGIISYPGYQVAVARGGDTVADVAARIGMDASELASYNGLQTSDVLRRDEVLALPRRVSEPSPATGAEGTGPIQPPSDVDIAGIAGAAIDRASASKVETSELPAAKPASDAPVGIEPIQHKVVRGETAYTISRTYGVSVRALADWNGLGPDFKIREGQFLLIPVPDTPAPKRAAAASTAPGQGSPTPTPPSASKPLPAEKTAPAAKAKAATGAPDLGKTQSTAKAAMDLPVNGSIIRGYKKGKNDGIDISAAPGTPVRAAASGTVAAITTDADQVKIILVKHQDNLLTVYANVDAISVKKGDSVKRGQSIGKIASGQSNYVHFEVRKGFDAVDPTAYLP
jgi:murein DD-endopeptidase MepM/ murein hydrolase activator NlpD